MDNINVSIRQAVITLGGKGTRLRTITKEVPKPLWKIDGYSTLERSVKFLKTQGIFEFIWITNFKYKLFEEEAKKLSSIYGVNILIHKEKSEKGEAGSLFDIFEKLNDEFIFLSGDIIFNVDINRISNFHKRHKSQITFVTHLTNHPEDSDCIIESPNLTIYKYKLKDDNSKIKGFFLGNAGLALISKNVIKKCCNNSIENQKDISLFKDIIIRCHNKKIKVFSYNTSEYLKDMGTPIRLEKASNDLKNGVVEKLSYLKSQKALFLDRDNTIIRCLKGEYITDFDQISLLKKRVEVISKIANNYDQVILVSNQPQISMGKVSWQKVIEINGEIIRKCQDLNLNISSFYLCPHHSHSGFEGEIIDLKSACFCRKPLPGMFLEASFLRNIDFKQSLMIGDSWVDKSAAENLNMQFINVKEID